MHVLAKAAIGAAGFLDGATILEHNAIKHISKKLLHADSNSRTEQQRPYSLAGSDKLRQANLKSARGRRIASNSIVERHIGTRLSLHRRAFRQGRREIRILPLAAALVCGVVLERTGDAERKLVQGRSRVCLGRVDRRIGGLEAVDAPDPWYRVGERREREEGEEVGLCESDHDEGWLAVCDGYGVSRLR